MGQITPSVLFETKFKYYYLALIRRNFNLLKWFPQYVGVFIYFIYANSNICL